MPRFPIRRITAILTLVLFVGLSGLASAAPRHATPSSQKVRQPSSVAAAIWAVLVHLWEKEGGSLDPDGLTRSGSTGFAGSSLDPSGAQGEEGGSLDPSGAK